MTFAKTSICVNYKFAEEWHVFSSEDLPGLYVASKHAEVAFKDVGNAIEKLVFLDEGIQCKAIPELTFKEFIEQTQGSAEDEIIVLSDKRFSLFREVAIA